MRRPRRSAARPLHVVGAALLEGGRCLVARRGPGMSQAGLWEFPGGKVEPGERPERALARELREELGLEAEIGEWLGRGTGRAGARDVVLDVYAARVRSGELHLREHGEVRFAAAGDLDDLDWPEADLPVLPVVRARLSPHPDAIRPPPELAIVSADWSTKASRRAVYTARARRGWRVERAEPPAGGWSLAALLERARRTADEEGRRVLVGIDAVLGVPARFARAAGVAGFFEALAWLERSGGLAGESASPRAWRPARPFFRVAPGAGGLTRFVERAGGRCALLRQIELRTHAKPVFVLSGIPGSVGSGSRALWRELGPLLAAPARDFRVWPFEGEVSAPSAVPIVLAEVYPRASYAIALAKELPARPLALAKTRASVRARALARLERSPWLAARGVRLSGVAAARASEDDFDALVTAAALVRHVAEGQPLSCPLVDPRVEGGILGTGLLALPGPGLRASSRTRSGRAARRP